ncbi:hypothetical protein ABPG72_008217 [Tetrahymena utriculariae]
MKATTKLVIWELHQLVMYQKIYENKIGNAGAISLGTILSNLQSLTSLELGLKGNQIGDSGAIQVGSSFKNLKELTNLAFAFSYNQIGDAGAIEIGTGISYLQNLASLSLSLYQLALASKLNTPYDKQERASFGSTWEERNHYLPDFMRVSGVASGYLSQQQVIIEFEIETLSDSA